MKKNYYELTGENKLNSKEMFSLKGGYQLAYGCESNVCHTNRSGAAGICQDAYCRSGVGPANPPGSGVCTALK